MTANQTRPVIVGVDGAPSNWTTIRYAAQEADRTGAALRLIHVSPSYVPMSTVRPVEPPMLQATGLEILRLARGKAEQTAPDVEVSTRLVSGPRVESLVHAGEDASLIVLGHAGRTLMARLWTGSTIVGTAARASCPVTSIPADWTEAAVHDRVIVGLKYPEHSRELLSSAFKAASARNAELRVLHAWMLPSAYADIIESRTVAQEWRERALSFIEPLLEDLKQTYSDVPVHVEVVHDQPAHALVKASKTADLIVMVRREHGYPASRHVGGTARAVLREASCPVEIVPASSTIAPTTSGLVLEEDGVRQK